MKKMIFVLATLLVVMPSAFADTCVNGYYRSDGTYVSGHYRSSPDSSYNNNWSVEGNYNPYTGKRGTRQRTWDDNYPSSCSYLLCD